MVLLDDQFGTIVAAIERGRVIFMNIRRSVMFMLCTNFAEVLVVTLASLAQAPIPLLPLQILFLNVLTDVFPALALGLGAGAAVVMKNPPRPAAEGVLTRHHWIAISAWSTALGACVLASLAIAIMALDFDVARAVTVSFLTLAFGKLWFVLNLRGRGANPVANDIMRNPWMGGALALCIPLLLAAVYWPPLAMLLDTREPGLSGWSLILGMSLVPVAIGLVVPGIRFHSGERGTFGTSTRTGMCLAAE
jgi:Ca2+-transporting ATPase